MASAVNCANRQRVEETLEKFVSFVDRHQWVIIVNTVSFFTEKMWERIIVPHFGDVARQIIHLTEGEIARLPTGHLPRQNDKERELSAIHLFIEECLEHRLENTNVLCNVDGVLNELGSGKSQIQDKELSSSSTVKLVQPRALMNIKKSHEVKEMASFAAKLALIHEVQKVVDIGSGKGYLGQYLSLQCGLDVIGIDSSDSNTHGAIDRNCKLQKNWQGISRHSMNAQQNCSQLENPIEAFKEKFTTKTHKLKEIQKFVKCSDKMSDTSLKIDRCRSQALVNMHESNSQSEGSEVSASHMVNWSRISQSESAFDDVHQRLMNIQQSDSQSPATLTSNEASDISHEMRISKHLQMIDLFSDDDCPAEVNKPKCEYNQTNHNSDSDKKENNPATQEGWNSSSNNSPCHGNGNATMNGSRFYPVTAFVEPSTTLTSMVSQNVEEAEQDKEIPFMLVGLHTCGDLAPSTLRLFVHNDTARVLLNVGCCYQRLSEEFETEGWTILETKPELCGFPMSHFLRSKGTKINRPARMLASMAADRIATSQIVPAMGLFYRSVLQVLLQDHYRLPTRSENVGKLAPKCRSFLEYARKALKKLQFDDSKLSDAEICTYAERFQPYYYQLQALNQLRVALAPTIEGLFLLDRLCYLQEQTSIHSAALVRLFDPVTSPRCYAILATR